MGAHSSANCWRRGGRLLPEEGLRDCRNFWGGLPSSETIAEAYFGSGVALQQSGKKIESRAGGQRMSTMIERAAVGGSAIRAPCRRRWHDDREVTL